MPQSSIRPSFVIPSLGVIERQYVNEIYRSMKKQNEEVLIEKNLHIINEQNISEEYIPFLVNRIVETKYKEDDKLQKILIVLLILVSIKGLNWNKRRLKNKIKNIPELKDLKFDFVEKITNAEYLTYITAHTTKLIKTINARNRQRIKKFIIQKLKKEMTTKQIVREISQLNGMSKRKAWTIVRTEMSYIHSKETELYFKKRGIQKWKWNCRSPKDCLCVLNCGEIRNIGESFPSGNISPPEHPNCICWLDSVDDISEFRNSMIAGKDWTGS